MCRACTSIKTISIVEEALKELLDTLYYMQDVFDTGVPALSEELFCALRAHLLQGVILPAIRQSRRPRTSADSAAGSVASYGGKRKVGNLAARDGCTCWASLASL